MASALQDIAPAPGQATVNQAPQAASTAAKPREAAPSDAGSSMGMLLPLALFVPLILVMFWSSRQQQKKQEKLIGDLKKGDMVLTQGGLRGRFVEMSDRFAKIEIAPGTKVDVLRSALLGKDTPEAAAQLERK